MATPIRFAPRFLRDFKGLPDDIAKEVDPCLRDLVSVPIPVGRRPHSVTPRGQRPAIHTVDLLANKSWKLSYMWQGPVIWVLRVATHKELDRDPGRSAAKSVTDGVVV
ncbi:hypothetical protein Acidovoranil_35510 [Acidovorax sp. FG27]